MSRSVAAIHASALAVTALVMSGCTASEETQEYTTQAVCASTEATVQSLEGSGAGARAAASLILDNAEDQHIRDVAQKVIDGDMDQQLRDELAGWVRSTCG